MINCLLQKMAELEKQITRIDDEIMEEYGDYPFLIVLCITKKQQTKIRKCKKQIKTIKKTLSKLLTNGLHYTCPQIDTYEEWCHYAIPLKKYFTKEDFEFEDKLRNEYLDLIEDLNYIRRFK